MGEQSRSRLLIWASVFFLTVLFILVRTAYAGFDQVLFGDNDDAMRMVVVRDFLAGQKWFDHTQYRLNTPYGGDMHWSRLVDVPIAALVLLVRPFAGSAAEAVAGYLWPTILLGTLIWLNGLLTLRLVGLEGLLPGMMIGAFSIITFGEFGFGRIDHHSVQIILTQVAVLATIDALERQRAAIGAGLAVATSLAIGTETLPVVVAVIVVFGLFYVFLPKLTAAVRWFALSFGLGTLGHLLLALPPNLWFSPACDALSVVYAAAALATGGALVVLTLVPAQTWQSRLVAGVLTGGLVLAAVAIAFPQCLAGPYAIVDPWLVENWLGAIGEAMPPHRVLFTQPDFVLGAGIPAVLALISALHAARRSTDTARIAWFVLAIVLGIIIAVACLQTRGIRLSLALIGPACAFWVVLARQRYLEKGSLGPVLGLVGSWLGFAGILWALLGHGIFVAARPPAPVAEFKDEFGKLSSRDECLKPSAYQDLAAMDPQRIMTPLDLGAYVLLYTQHEVVSAPYHRNNQALLDTFAFLNGPTDEARAIVAERDVTLVVTCDALPEMMGRGPTDSFVERARNNTLPDWIETLDLPGPLKIYRVLG